jgi:hypothetical protein
MPGRAGVDERESAMADADPVRDGPCLAGSPVSGHTTVAILGQEVLMDVPVRIYEGDAFVVRTPVAHGAKTSMELGRVGLMGLNDAVAGDSTHASHRSERQRSLAEQPSVSFGEQPYRQKVCPAVGYPQGSQRAATKRKAVRLERPPQGNNYMPLRKNLLS